MIITDNIRRLREASKLTQEAMAERMNTTRSNYAYLENRGEKLTVEQLQNIADALECPVILLLLDPEEKHNPSEQSDRIKELEKQVQQSQGQLAELIAEAKTLRQSLDTYNFMFKYIMEEKKAKESDIMEAAESNDSVKEMLLEMAKNLKRSEKFAKLENLGKSLEGE